MKLTELQKVEKYLDVKKNHVYAKTSITIAIDPEELKANDEELLDVADSSDESGQEDLQGSIAIPGMLNIQATDYNDEVQLYFPFEINLIVPDTNEKTKGIIYHYYEKGDLIMFAITKSSATDIQVLDSLFENRVRYLRDDAEKHLVTIYDQLLSTSNIKMVHIQLIMSQLYGEYDASGEFKPVRLGSGIYSSDTALSTKESAHRLNSIVGYNYGYSKDNIVHSISRKYEPSKTDLEKVVGGHFDDL